MNGVKKVLNIVLILIGVCLIAFCADLMSNKLSKTKLEQLDETDRSAVEEICGIISQFDEKYGNDDVWTENYNPNNYSFVITRRLGFVKGRTYAVNMNISKDIFAQKIDMPEEYSDISVYRIAYFAPETFALSRYDSPDFTQFKDNRVLASSFDKQNVAMNGSGSLEESQIKLTFLDAVESIDTPAASENDHFTINEENVALLGLQYRILDDMLASPDEAQMKELIAEYVTVREYQNEKYPEYAAERENIELKNGCAQYVFYNVSDLIGHDITYFNKDRSDTITFYSAYYYLCTGRYNSDVGEFLDCTGNEYTGAALCRIIEDNRLAAEWQYKLNGAQGTDLTSQYTIIKNYCGGTCSEFTDKTIDDIKATYNYDEIKSMAHTLCEAVG